MIYRLQKKAHRKMFKWISHWGNANLNHSEIHYTSIRTAKIKNPANSSSGEDAKQLQCSYPACRDAKNTICLKTVWQFCKNKINFQIIQQEHSYPKERRYANTYTHTNIYMCIYTHTHINVYWNFLCKDWKQPRHSFSEWMVCEYYRILPRNKKEDW